MALFDTASENDAQKPARLLTEDEAAEVLRGGGSKHATNRTLRWLLQKPGAPSRPDFLVDLAAVADYLRRETGEAAPGLRGAAALFDKIVPKGAKPRALSYAERQARSRAKDEHADIRAELDAAFEKVNWVSRRRGERDLVYFLKTYCTGEGGFLETPPPAEMHGIVREMESGVGSTAVPYHIRMPRGTGKTSYEKGTVKWAIASGRRRYVVAVAANSENAENIIDDVYSGITENPAFVRDWPEIAVPFLEMGGAFQRAKTQTYRGEPTNPKKTADKIVLPTIRDPKTGQPFPSSGAKLDAVGFSAGARGKGKMAERPDLLILDDLQSDDTAESEGQVLKAIRKIKKTFMGLGGHKKKIAAIMTSTPIAANDISETFAKDRGWRTSTFRLVTSWPNCHNPEKPNPPGETDYWEEYADIMEAEKNAGREPHKAGNRYYAKNRKAMDAGAAVLNPGNFDRATEKSGIQHAMNLLFRDGLDAFMSEYQMTPPRNEFAFEISARLILSKIRRGVPAKAVPAQTVMTVAATDINPGYGITTAVVAFDVQQTGLVVAYNVKKVRIPEKLNDVEFNRRVYEALAETGREIAALGVTIDKWGVDAGGRQFQSVTQFAAMSQGVCGLTATAMLGRAGQNWNPNVRSRIRSAKNETVLCQDPQHRRWLAWNADHYKEKMHRAWGTEVGAPGGLSLFDGGANHSKFATQVANEKLVAKTKVGEDRWAYKWQTKEPHDFGDAVAMCYALAGSENLTGDGAAPRRSRGRCAVGGMPRRTADAKPDTTPNAATISDRPRIMIGHA